MGTKTSLHLRFKLFFWVGGLFVLFFLGALVLENAIIENKLASSENILRKEQNLLHDQKRRDLEAFLEKNLSQKQARIDALLYEIKNYPLYELVEKTPNDASIWSLLTLILSKNPWVGFLELSVGENTYSLNTGEALFEEITSYEINEKFSWILIKDRLYLSIVFPKEFVKKTLGENSSILQEESLQLAYDWKTLLQLFSEIPQRKKRSNLLQKELFAAAKYVHTKKSLLESNNLRELLKFTKRKKTSRKSRQTLLSKTPEKWQETFQHFIEKSEKIAISQFLVSLEKKNYLGSASEKYQPVGVVFLPFLQGKDAYLSRKNLFKKETNLEEMRSSKEKPLEKIFLSEKIAVRPKIIGGRAFVINTHENSKIHPKNILVTAGESIEPILKMLATVSHQKVLLLDDEKVFSVYAPGGEKISLNFFEDLDLSPSKETPTGTFSISGEKYFYLQLSPFEKKSLCFYLIEPYEQAFQLLAHVRIETEKIASNISRSIAIGSLIALVIALILLENIAKNITKPITRLAETSKKIKEGHVHDVELPEIEKGASKELISLITSFNAMAKELSEKEKVRSILNKMVSKQVASELLKKELHLGGELRETVVLFADIREFTKITEHMQPENVIEILNTCMTKITSIVEKNGGIIDKYVGDQAMALFGAPIFLEKPYFLAVKTAIEIQKSLAKWNQERASRKEIKIEVGIGINGGSVLAGNMGAEDRLNYTVLGAHVNLAARLCKYAGPGEVLISENVLHKDHLEELCSFEKKEQKTFKGFSHPFTIFQINDLRK